MTIVVLTLGTRGDVQPFVALGRALQALGHRVRVCTCQRFESFVTERGLEYGYLDDAVLQFIEGDRVREMIGARRNNVLQWLRSAVELLPKVKDMQRRMLDEQWQACSGADLVIYHPKALGGPHIAEKLGVPAVAAPPFPAYVPTAEFPMIILGAKSRGAWINRASYALTRRGQAAIAGILNDFREKTLRLPRRRRLSVEPWELGGKPIPVMHPISAHVLPRPADWPGHAALTGFWFLDRSDDWQPGEALVRFLDDGSPPVYIGFGSMVTHEPGRYAGVVVDAVSRAGVRAILSRGWGGLQPDSVPPGVHLIDDVPHDWLLPRCAAVVHHGGAGSTAAGLRAGRPTLIVPHIADQPLWGRRVRELGVGPPPLPKKHFAAETLASRIRDLVDEPSYAAAASDLGDHLRAERGCDNAVQFMRDHGALPPDPG